MNRKINYHIAVTLDGYICHQDASIDGFLMEGPHADDFVSSLQNYDAVLMGSKTYQFGFQFGLEPGQPAYPGLHHYVFSRSLSFESSDSVTLVNTSVCDKVNELRNMNGKDIWLCGGGELAGYLLNKGLIDTLTVKVNPILFGSGRQLFCGLNNPVSLTHTSSKTYPNGVVLNEYLINKNM
ncbi:dihydrofolate reductase family protein [Arenicella xantha]|uniref:Dihydrofolate reductase n=1 Tax=Arenicella xantha TaxID=644221 RepID=A0A395JPC2_9GAMM|nr:dihydrofolate reductase family protein [Arenicella xantha]RBP53347.1 dihydrofolate reductase [Arenicella xantha]